MNDSTKNLLLDHYHCTFFLPLIGVEKKDFQPKAKYAWKYPADYSLAQAQAEAETEAEVGAKDQEAMTREIEAQAYRFFSPAIRNILFDLDSEKTLPNQPEAMKEWRIPPKDLKTWELHLGTEEDKKKNDPLKYQEASVTSVTLYRYFNGIYLLAFRVEPKALKVLRDGQKKEAEHPFFSDQAPSSFFEMASIDPSRKDLYKQLQLESWLHFTRLARLIYPSFPQQNDEKKIAPITLMIDGKKTVAFSKRQKVAILKQPGEDISPVIRRILEEFATTTNTVKPFLDNYANIYDDRMFVSAAYGLAGRQLPQEQLKKLFYLALYADRHEDAFDVMDGHVYTPEAIAQLTQPRTLDLWNGLGGYYGYTEFSNAYLSCGWDFRTYIAPEHIPYIYDRMLIQALFYQASLRHYDNLISDETQKLQRPNGLKTIRKQRKAFIHFTNRYWFHDLTEQMQGKAIFSLQQQGLGLQKHYDIIKDELERTDEYLLSELSAKFTRWGLGIAIFALYYAALALVPDPIKETLWRTLFGGFDTLTNVPEWLQKLLWMLVIVPIILVVVAMARKPIFRQIAQLYRWLKGQLFR